MSPIERITCDSASYTTRPLFLEHITRYHLAQRYAAHKKVLDAGCGTGYGILLLSKKALMAVGIDENSEAIRYCQEKNRGAKVSYKMMDARKIDYDDNFFDVVVAFELLEHISEQDQFLKGVHRVLKKGGRLIISTPNIHIYGMGKAKNPYHKKELTPAEFLSILKPDFCIEKLFGQTIVKEENTIIENEVSVQHEAHNGAADPIKRLKSFIKKLILRDNFFFRLYLVLCRKEYLPVPIAAEQLGRFKYMIAVCRKM